MFHNTDNTLFIKFKILEENHQKIKEEIPNFDKSLVTIKRNQGEWYDTKKGGELLNQLLNNSTWVASWTPDNIWYNFPLMANNKVIGEAEKICPTTIGLLKTLGNINIAGFSLLIPNSSLPVHNDETGPTYNSMALNMKLVGGVANLYVKDKNKFASHRHMTGKVVIFNSECDHYADNKGTTDRVILYIDFSL
jgi:aspartyl/asparaginyl beta-hydroxylase (cupin superfamily)